MEPLTQKEEEVVEVCDMCKGAGEIDMATEPDETRVVPCPKCNPNYYEGDNDQDHD